MKMPGVVNLHLESTKVQKKLIVAVCHGNGIGINNQLPWRLKSELAHFARLTKSTIDFSKKNAVIMGRKTWESLPQRVRPLKNRINIVLTRSKTREEITDQDDVLVAASYDEALDLVDEMGEKVESCWVIGGSAVYKEAMENSRLDKIFITKILNDYDCDTFFPSINIKEWKSISDKMVPEAIQTEENIQFKYEVYERDQK